MKPFFKMMFRTFKMVFVLLWILAFLCSCPGPAMASRMDRIDPKNFPNTVWSCRELDMVIYMFEGRKKDICGTFSVNEETYCIDVEYTVNAGGRFKLYSYSEKSVSELDSSLVHYQVSYIGSIDVSWDYQKRTGNLVAKVRGFDESIPETIPETLTFDKVGSFGETPKTRWVAEEYDLYLDSFSDTDKYYSGEITIEGERFHIYAREIAQKDYFQLVLINEHNIRYEWVRMSFAVSDDQIVAIRSDTDYSKEYWNPDLKSITFHSSHIE